MIEKDEKKKKHQPPFRSHLDTSELEELEELGIFLDEDEIEE